ncbi:MAG: lipid-A-disaccharide synthase N-terminal domain-containing protein [Notoacmeibacter sp.]
MIAHLAGLSDWFYRVFVEQFDGWIALGFIAQFMFTMRFIVQWLASERVGKSVIPIAFWFFSLGGGSLLLVYAIQRGDPVFIAGQALGILIYIRNLMLIFRPKKQA